MIKKLIQQIGFSLIELLMFIVITSISIAVFSQMFSGTIAKSPDIHSQFVATEVAQSCMEWYLGQRRTQGFASLTCPSTPTATLCSAPPDYTVSTSITCATIDSDSNYKKITVTVSGAADASISSLIAEY